MNTNREQELYEAIADWKPSQGMSQDLPGAPLSRIALEDGPTFRSLLAQGRVEVVELRGKKFVRAVTETVHLTNTRTWEPFCWEADEANITVDGFTATHDRATATCPACLTYTEED